MFNGGNVRRPKGQLRGESRFEGFEPAWQTQAPAVARLQSRKLIFGMRRRQVIACVLRKLEEPRRHHCTDGVHSVIITAGLALPGSKESSQRISGTDEQVVSENVLVQSPVLLKQKQCESLVTFTLHCSK